jgi:hypothetical protein
MNGDPDPNPAFCPKEEYLVEYLLNCKTSKPFGDGGFFKQEFFAFLIWL